MYHAGKARKPADKVRRSPTMATKLEDGTEVYTKDELDSEVKGLKAKRDEVLAALSDTKSKLKEVSDRWDGLDADEVRKLVKDSKDKVKDAAKATGDIAAYEAQHKADLEQLKAAHKKELDTRSARETKLMSTVERSLVDAELTRAIAEKKGDAGLLLPHARQYVRVKETDDGFHPYVVDEHGNGMVSDGQGSPMTFSQLVETKLLTQYPRAFDGVGSSGSGSSRSAGVGQGSKSIAADDDRAFLANLAGIASGAVGIE